LEIFFSAVTHNQPNRRLYILFINLAHFLKWSDWEIEF